MLQKDYITNILGIANISADKIERNREGVHIYISTKQSVHVCPCCGQKTKYIHDYRTQKIKDLNLYGEHCYLMLRKRRYVCGNCGKRFYEKYDFLPKYSHFSQRVYLSILKAMERKASCKDIAAEHNVSSATVLRIFSLRCFTARPQLPEVLGIDEFKGNTGGEKYNCVITDITNSTVLDILPSRKKEKLLTYFRKYTKEERSKVKVFVCDMWKDYREISTLFPAAILVTDKYHWVRQAIWAVENVRKRVQKTFPANKRLHFKRNKYILLAPREKLGIEDGIVLEYMLNQNTDLYNAWQLKELFYKFKDSASYDEAAERLKEFILYAEREKIKEFDNCLKALHNWSAPILNSFKYKYTNAFTEGMNNNIKVLKRIAYGYRNFDNFRRRILCIYSNGKAA